MLNLRKGLCNSDIKTRRKLAFGTPLLLLIIAGSFYRASLSTSPAYELLNTVFLIAIALGIILLAYAIKLDSFIYKNPIAIGCCILVLTCAVYAYFGMKGDLVARARYHHPQFSLWLAVAFGILTFYRGFKTNLGYMLYCLVLCTVLTFIVCFLNRREVFVFFPTCIFLLVFRVREELQFCSYVSKRNIHYLLIGWILLLFCAVIAMHASSLVGKSQLDALFAPTADPQGAGFFPLSIRNELSNIQFLGEMANVDPDSFIIFIMEDPDQTLLYIAAKWGWLALAAISLLYFSFVAGTIFLQKGKYGIARTTTYILVVICTVCYILSLLGSFGVGSLYTFFPFFSGNRFMVSLLLLSFEAMISPNEADDHELASYTSHRQPKAR